jgi:hypothetical protein
MNWDGSVGVAHFLRVEMLCTVILVARNKDLGPQCSMDKKKKLAKEQMSMWIPCYCKGRIHGTCDRTVLHPSTEETM